MKVCEKVQENVRAMRSQIKRSQDALALYLNGVAAGMGLTGEHTFDERTMEFREIRDDKQGETDD